MASLPSSRSLLGLSLLLFCLVLSAAEAAAGSGWMALPNAPPGGDFQDAFFVNPDLGWVVNGAGQINRTTDGGESWSLQVDEPTNLRCVGFVDSLKGWVGNLNGTPLLYATTNGGALWTAVTNIPQPLPTGICGIWVVNASVAYACGKYDATSARVIKTTDGGASWTSMDLVPLANSLIDCYFTDENNGFVVGSIGEVIGAADTRRAVILATTDGGASWTTRHTSDRLAEWCWKISFPTVNIGYVSIERFSGATYFLKTTDGGQTWQDHLFMNYIVQGIGFVSPALGWIGGPTGPTYQSTDGGSSWQPAGFGVHINRFRFLGLSPGYAVGSTVYKYTSSTGIEPAETPSSSEIVLAQNYPNPFNRSTSIAYTLDRTSDVKVTIVNAMGRRIITLVDGRRTQGTHELHWNAQDIDGNSVGAGIYWYWLEVGGRRFDAKRLLLLK